MNKVFEALERLAMPDELHKQECERLGIGLTEDYDLIKSTLNRLEAIDKLQEELGCPLDILERALMNGIYTNVYSGLCIVSRYKDVLNVSDDYGVYIKDYKKNLVVAR